MVQPISPGSPPAWCPGRKRGPGWPWERSAQQHTAFLQPCQRHLWPCSERLQLPWSTQREACGGSWVLSTLQVLDSAGTLLLLHPHANCHHLQHTGKALPHITPMLLGFALQKLIPRQGTASVHAAGGPFPRSVPLGRLMEQEPSLLSAHLCFSPLYCWLWVHVEPIACSASRAASGIGI